MMASILLLGDSITAGFPVGRLLKECSIVNQGISGDNTDLVLARLERDVIDRQPRAVFLMIGTNDMASGFSNEKTLSNYEQILIRLRLGIREVKVYVQSILPTRGLENRPLDRIRHLNAEIARLADKHGMKFLDLTPLFADSRGEIAGEFSEDGLHLTDAAYTIWAAFLRPYINELP